MAKEGNQRLYLGVDKVEKRDELYALLLKKEYPEPFCREVAYKYLNTDYTAGRMMSYLGRENKPNIEMLVYEMFAIILWRRLMSFIKAYCRNCLRNYR